MGGQLRWERLRAASEGLAGGVDVGGFVSLPLGMCRRVVLAGLRGAQARLAWSIIAATMKHPIDPEPDVDPSEWGYRIKGSELNRALGVKRLNRPHAVLPALAEAAQIYNVQTGEFEGPLFRSLTYVSGRQLERDSEIIVKFSQAGQDNRASGSKEALQIPVAVWAKLERMLSVALLVKLSAELEGGAVGYRDIEQPRMQFSAAEMAVWGEPGMTIGRFKLERVTPAIDQLNAATAGAITFKARDLKVGDAGETVIEVTASRSIALAEVDRIGGLLSIDMSFGHDAVLQGKRVEDRRLTVAQQTKVINDRVVEAALKDKERIRQLEDRVAELEEELRRRDSLPSGAGINRRVAELEKELRERNQVMMALIEGNIPPSTQAVIDEYRAQQAGEPELDPNDPWFHQMPVEEAKEVELTEYGFHPDDPMNRVLGGFDDDRGFDDD
jgi:hypothetical protein